MGILGWLLKNGPGSPGSTSKVFINEYLKYNNINHSENWESIFTDLYQKRVTAFNQIGIGIQQCYYKDVEMDEIIKYSDGDLALFVFEMMFLETANFRRNIPNTFNNVTKIIYDIISNEIPHSLIYELNEFRIYAKEFMTNFD